MVLGRVYTVSFSAVSVSAIQDLVYLKAASDKPIVPLEAIFTVDSSETNEQMKVTIKRLGATVTVGSVGSSVTARKTASGNAAASFTARANDTTQATSSGTTETLHAEGFPSQGGWEYKPDLTDRFQFISTEACVFELSVAPGSAINMSGKVTVMELG